MTASASKQTWQRTKLGNYFRIKHGFAFKGAFFSDSGPYVLLTPGNFREGGGLKLKGEKEKYYTGSFPQEFLLRRGDLLVAMTDLKQDAPILGSAAFVTDDKSFLHNQRLGKIVDLKEEEMDKRFLFYLFNFRAVRQQIKASATGATVRHTAPDRIYSVEVEVPSLSTQRKIASVLSAYDDLIENNTRRIQILEEMAQAIYREWFVNFRFPGHEKARVVDSELGPIPEGWEVKTLGEVAEQVRRNVKPKQFDPGTPYVGLEHIPRKSIALSEWGAAEDVQSSKLAFNKGEILFSKIRPYFHKVAVAPLNGLCSSDTIVISPMSIKYFSTVLCTVSSEEFVDHATQTSQGTKMPRADWTVLVKYPMVIPSAVLLQQFNELVEDIVSQIQNLTFRNRNLHQTRDLLLPKLISGEVDAEDMDLVTEEARVS